MKNIYTLISVLIFASINIYSQGIFEEKDSFTRQDTLRGTITKERSWWDLNYYHLDIRVDPDKKYIEGRNTIFYTVLSENRIMQIDLQEPLIITSVTEDGISLNFIREGNAFFIELQKKQNVGEVNNIIISYQGNPKTAVRAPWDGGFSWDRDENGNLITMIGMKD